MDWSPSLHPRAWFVYVLRADQRSAVRYVGLTQDPAERLAVHSAGRERSTAEWAIKLTARGRSVTMGIVGVFYDRSEAAGFERHLFASHSGRLLNRDRRRGLSGNVDDVPTPLGERIRSARTAAEISSRQLSKSAGLNPSHVWLIEQGYIRSPHASLLRKIAARLGAEPAWLVSGVGQPPTPQQTAAAIVSTEVA